MSDEEIETIDSYTLRPGWSSKSFNQKDLAGREDIKEFLESEGVPVGDKDYLIMADMIFEDERIVYQWIKKTSLEV